MKSMCIIGLVGIVCCAAGCTPPTWEKGRPAIYAESGYKKLAVLGFGNREVDDVVLDTLVSNSNWTVVDRATLNRVLSEQNLLFSGRFDRETAVRIGKLAGAHYIVFGAYAPDSCTIQIVDVEQGTYVTYKREAAPRVKLPSMFTFTPARYVNAWEAPREAAYHVLKHLVPYAKIRWGTWVPAGSSVTWFLGGNSDQRSDYELNVAAGYVRRR